MSPLPLISPPDIVPDIILPDWSGPGGAPRVNNRLPVAPPLDGSSLLSLITNRITNPTFEVDLAGWTVNGAGATQTRVTTQFVNGVASMQLTGATAGTLRSLINLSSPVLVAGTTYYARYWIRADANAAGETAQVLLWETGGASASETTAVASRILSNGVWELMECFGTLKKADRTTVQLYVGIPSGAEAADTIFIDGALAVSGVTHPIAYFDGNSLDARWTGTAHASSSEKRLDFYNNTPVTDWTIQDVTTDFVSYPV